MKSESNKVKWLNLRLSEEEFLAFKRQQQKSIFRKMSDYGRAVLLGKPVTVFYRNKSMDDALEEFAFLRKELNAIGTNLNQLTRHINAAGGNPVPGSWIDLIRMVNKRLEPKIAEIKEQLNKYSDVWSQRLNTEKA